jgi:hypothetical protein
LKVHKNTYTKPFGYNNLRDFRQFLSQNYLSYTGMTDNNSSTEIQKILIANKLKKELEKVADTVENDDKSINDPLKYAKGIIKYYGQKNRLI